MSTCKCAGHNLSKCEDSGRTTREKLQDVAAEMADDNVDLLSLQIKNYNIVVIVLCAKIFLGLLIVVLLF